MAFSHGKLTVFKIDNAAGALQDISTYTNMVDFGRELDEAETTCFGAGASRTYISGFSDSKIKIGGFWDPTIHGILGPLYSAHRSGSVTSSSIEYGPAGSTAGYQKMTAEVVVLSYNIKTDVKGAAEWEMELHASGLVTDTTW